MPIPVTNLYYFFKTDKKVLKGHLFNCLGLNLLGTLSQRINFHGRYTYICYLTKAQYQIVSKYWDLKIEEYDNENYNCLYPKIQENQNETK